MLPKLRTLAVVLLAALAATADVRAGDAEHCGESGYSYAGLLATGSAYGVAADVRALRPAQVVSGHVAAWVGVGGYGLGKHGTDAWLQAGLITKEGGAAVVYYEVTRPGYRPVLAELAPARADRTYRVAVLEVVGRPGWWRVWLDGRAVTPPISLPGSHGSWAPTATAESWDGGRRVCNRFAFGFAGVSVATSPGGSWRPLAHATVLASPGHRVVRSGGGFTAAA